MHTVESGSPHWDRKKQLSCLSANSILIFLFHDCPVFFYACIQVLGFFQLRLFHYDINSISFKQINSMGFSKVADINLYHHSRFWNIFYCLLSLLHTQTTTLSPSIIIVIKSEHVFGDRIFFFIRLQCSPTPQHLAELHSFLCSNNIPSQIHHFVYPFIVNDI